jgi:hypothetical protein
MILLTRILTTIASLITIGFGIWHFFVPKIWNWYSYIDSEATELVIAVRAINVFFSLSLVLFGITNILFLNTNKSNKFSIIVVLSTTSMLWIIRTVFQFIFPQGSKNPIIQYSMLFTFLLVTFCFVISLCIIIFQKNDV